MTIIYDPGHVLSLASPQLLRVLEAHSYVGKKRLSDAWDTPARWKIIRDYYRDITPEILAGNRIDPYALGLAEHFTPIERAVWGEIRRIGLPFYPQYPVGRRFVDFGDPQKRLAIEVDGAAFHTPERDAEKDQDLWAQDWEVFRIKGRDAIYAPFVLNPILYLYGRQEEKDEDGEQA